MQFMCLYQEHECKQNGNVQNKLFKNVLLVKQTCLYGKNLSPKSLKFKYKMYLVLSPQSVEHVCFYCMGGIPNCCTTIICITLKTNVLQDASNKLKIKAFMVNSSMVLIRFFKRVVFTWQNICSCVSMIQENSKENQLRLVWLKKNKIQFDFMKGITQFLTS